MQDTCSLYSLNQQTGKGDAGGWLEASNMRLKLKTQGTQGRQLDGSPVLQFLCSRITQQNIDIELMKAAGDTGHAHLPPIAHRQARRMGG